LLLNRAVLRAAAIGPAAYLSPHRRPGGLSLIGLAIFG